MQRQYFPIPVGNILVLVALFRSRDLKKSARYILIGLLAFSDLLLSFTMPFTAIDVLTKYWPFGSDSNHLCRSVKTSSAVAVYLSSMTLIAIACDRHHCIVNSSRYVIHSVEISWFFYYSDFTWNQFWWFYKCKICHFNTLEVLNFVNLANIKFVLIGRFCTSRMPKIDFT